MKRNKRRKKKTNKSEVKVSGKIGIDNAIMYVAVMEMTNYLNEIVNFTIHEYSSSAHTKNQIISGSVGQFIATQLSSFGQEGMLELQQFSHGDSSRVDLNILLDNLGGLGTRIGAFAYVLAVKLEEALPEDNSDVQDVAKVEILAENEYRFLGGGTPVPGFQLSDCYLRYIQKDTFIFDIFLGEK